MAGKELRGNPKIGVERYTFFEVESDTAEGITYKEPYHLKGTVEISPTDNGGSDVFDADNGAYDILNYIEKMGHELTNADIPPEVDAMWRGLELKNGVFSFEDNGKTVYFGVAWKVKLKMPGATGFRYIRYKKGSYSFASNVGAKTAPSSGAPERQTAKATYTAVKPDYDGIYYELIDETDLPDGVTKEELEEKWFTDMNWYPEGGTVQSNQSAE